LKINNLTSETFSHKRISFIVLTRLFLAKVAERGKTGEVSRSAGVRVVVAQGALHRIRGEEADSGEGGHQSARAQVLSYLCRIVV
jgi:hypothetical protein